MGMAVPAPIERWLAGFVQNANGRKSVKRVSKFLGSFAELSDDHLLDYLLKGSAISMAVRVIGMIAALASHLILSRFLGAQEYGYYVISLGWAMVLVIPARMGLDNAALRFATVYRQEGRSGALLALILGSLAMIAGTSSVIALVLLGLKLARAPFLSGVEFSLLVWVAAMVFPLAILGWLSALIRTAHKIFSSQFYEQVLRPVLLIAALGLFLVAGFRLDAGKAMFLTVACTTAATIGIALQIGHIFKSLRGTAPDFGERRLWLSVSWVLLVMSIAQEIANQLEIILLGILADATAAAHFSAAWRLASLVPFGLVAIVTVSGPLIASAFRRADLEEMARIARLNARFSFGFALIMAILLAALGRIALGAFGPSFAQAYPALLILLVGGVVNAFTGSVGYFLLMTGHQVAALIILTVSLALGLALNVLLIPILGVTGSAIASTSCVSFWNVAMLVYVRRKIGIDASALGLRPMAQSLDSVT